MMTQQYVKINYPHIGAITLVASNSKPIYLMFETKTKDGAASGSYLKIVADLDSYNLVCSSRVASKVLSLMAQLSIPYTLGKDNSKYKCHLIVRRKLLDEWFNSFFMV